MILLDTHIWIWWVSEPERLTDAQQRAVEQQQWGVSAISCWEVAKLVELGRLSLDRTVSEWVTAALTYPGCQLMALSPEVAVASTMLPGTFHRDPADQIIAATARVHGMALVTSDRKILDYEHVETIS